MGKKYMRDTSLYAQLDELGLNIDEKYLYMYLSVNKHMHVSGLYEIDRREIGFETGISRERLEGCLERLAQHGLIIYDNGLMFVPDMPVENAIEARNWWRQSLVRVRANHAAHKSEMPGSVNKSYAAFLSVHAERLATIDASGLYDLTAKKSTKKATTVSVGPTTDAVSDDVLTGDDDELVSDHAEAFSDHVPEPASDHAPVSDHEPEDVSPFDRALAVAEAAAERIRDPTNGTHSSRDLASNGMYLPSTSEGELLTSQVPNVTTTP